MKKSRYTDSQILAILKQNEAGTSVADLCREHGMSDAIFYKWRSKYGGMDVSDAKRLKQLEDENRRLKKLLADQMLEAALAAIPILQETPGLPAWIGMIAVTFGILLALGIIGFHQPEQG